MWTKGYEKDVTFRGKPAGQKWERDEVSALLFWSPLKELPSIDMLFQAL